MSNPGVWLLAAIVFGLGGLAFKGKVSIGLMSVGFIAAVTGIVFTV